MLLLIYSPLAAALFLSPAHHSMKKALPIPIIRPTIPANMVLVNLRLLRGATGGGGLACDLDIVGVQ